MRKTSDRSPENIRKHLKPSVNSPLITCLFILITHEFIYLLYSLGFSNRTQSNAQSDANRMRSKILYAEFEAN